MTNTKVTHHRCHILLGFIVILSAMVTPAIAIEWPAPPSALLEQADPELRQALAQRTGVAAGPLVITKRLRAIEVVDAQLAIAIDLLSTLEGDQAAQLGGYLPLLEWMSSYPLADETGRQEDWLAAAQQYRQLTGRQEVLVIGLEVPEHEHDRQRSGELVAGRLTADGYREEWRQAVDDVASIGMVGPCIEALAFLLKRNDGPELNRRFSKHLGSNNHREWSGSIANEYWASAAGYASGTLVTKLKEANEATGMRIPLYAWLIYRIAMREDLDFHQAPRKFDANVAKRLWSKYPDHWRRVLNDTQRLTPDERWQRIIAALPTMPDNWDVWSDLLRNIRICRRPIADKVLIAWQWLQQDPQNLAVALTINAHLANNFSEMSKEQALALEQWRSALMKHAQSLGPDLRKLHKTIVYERILKEGLSDGVIDDLITQYRLISYPIPLDWWQDYMSALVNHTPQELRLRQGLALAQAAVDLAKEVNARDNDPLHMVPSLLARSYYIWGSYRQYASVIPSEFIPRQRVASFWRALLKTHHPQEIFDHPGPWLVGLDGIAAPMISRAYDNDDLDLVLELTAPWFRDWHRFTVSRRPASITYNGTWMQVLGWPWVGATQAGNHQQARDLADYYFQRTGVLQVRNLRDLSRLSLGEEDATQDILETGISGKTMLNTAWVIEQMRIRQEHDQLFTILEAVPLKEKNNLFNVVPVYWAKGAFTEAHQWLSTLSHKDIHRDNIGYLALARWLTAAAANAPIPRKEIDQLWKRGRKRATEWEQDLWTALQAEEFPWDRDDFRLPATLVAWASGDLEKALRMSDLDPEIRYHWTSSDVDTRLLHQWLSQHGPTVLQQREEQAAQQREAEAQEQRRRKAEAAAEQARQAAAQREAKAQRQREEAEATRKQEEAKQRRREAAARRAAQSQSKEPRHTQPSDDGVSDLF